MLVHVPDHFSTNFKFDFSKLPATAVDRFSIKYAICGWLFGLPLLLLGIFELFSFLSTGKDSGQSYLIVEIFAFIIILLGLGLIIGSTFSFVRYKKISFDGKKFHIVYHSSPRVEQSIDEPLTNYIGVRLRVLFTQTGIFNKNRYIIDLYHQDPSKIIPLFISTKNINIRKIWENYAILFKLPALNVGDRGLVRREYTDLNKSVQELAKANKLPYLASGNLPAPESIVIKKTSKALFIEPKGIYWDIFSALFLTIAIVAIFLLSAIGIYLTIIGMDLPIKYWCFGGGLFLLLIYSATKLFNTYTLTISTNKVSVHRLLFGAPVKTESISPEKIESVELSYNPIIDRYSLAIISDDRIISFGSRLPVNDLLWLKDFVLRKLIGN